MVALGEFLDVRYSRQMKSDSNEHLGEVEHCGRMMIYLSDSRVPVKVQIFTIFTKE